MLVPSKYIKTQAERLNVLPAFIYVEMEPDFDEMSFRLNPRPIILESEAPSVFSLVRSIDPSYNIEYRRYIQLADEMRAAVDQARAVSHAAPTANKVQNIPTPAASVEWICPACGGSNTGKFCEYCGTPRP